MKNRVVSNKVSETFEKTIKISKGPYVLCVETYVRGKLSDQRFSPVIVKAKGYAPHNGYKPEKMVFYYFGGKLDSHKVISEYFSGKIPEQVFIKDLESFSDFKNLYCLWMSMDGNMYSLLERDPLPCVYQVRLKESEYDLNKCREALKNKNRVKDLNIVDNCVANWDTCGHHDLSFEYFATRPMTIKLSNTYSCYLEDIIAKSLGLAKYKKK